MFLHRLCVTVPFTHAQKFGIMFFFFFFLNVQTSECEADPICVWALTHEPVIIDHMRG